LFNSLQQTKEDLKSLNIDVDKTDIYNEREKTQLKENVTIRANPTRKITGNTNANALNISNNVASSNVNYYPTPQAYPQTKPLFEHNNNIFATDPRDRMLDNGNNVIKQNRPGSVTHQIFDGVKMMNAAPNMVNVGKNAENIKNLKSNIADIMNELKTMKKKNIGYN